MVDAWLTTMSTNLEAVINPLIAACEEGFLPDELYVLENPGVGDQFDDITSMMERVVVEYGGGPGPLRDAPRDGDGFPGIVEHFREPIAQIQTDGVRRRRRHPGRKFMSAIAFQAGIQFEADHVFYLYVSNNRFYGRLYPDVPRPVVELVDFQEVF